MSNLGSLSQKHVKKFVEWLQREKRLQVQRVCQPWMVAEVFTGKVWEAIYYAPSDAPHQRPLVGRGLRSLVVEFNESRQTGIA